MEESYLLMEKDINASHKIILNQLMNWRGADIVDSPRQIM